MMRLATVCLLICAGWCPAAWAEFDSGEPGAATDRSMVTNDEVGPVFGFFGKLAFGLGKTLEERRQKKAAERLAVELGRLPLIRDIPGAKSPALHLRLEHGQAQPLPPKDALRVLGATTALLRWDENLHPETRAWLTRKMTRDRGVLAYLHDQLGRAVRAATDPSQREAFSDLRERIKRLYHQAARPRSVPNPHSREAARGPKNPRTTARLHLLDGGRS